MYTEFARAAKIRYEVESSTYLEKVSAEAKALNIENQLVLMESDIAIEERKLQLLINDTNQVHFVPAQLVEPSLVAIMDSNLLRQNPLWLHSVQQIEIAKAEKEVEVAKTLPDIWVGYFNQSMTGMILDNGSLATSGQRFQGIQAGVAIPIFYRSQKANVQTKELKYEMQQTQSEYFQHTLQSEYQQQLQLVLKFSSSVSFYKLTALQQADLIIESAQKSYTNGAIGYVEYFQGLTQGLDIKIDYLEALNGYNQAVVNLEFLLGVR